MASLMDNTEITSVQDGSSASLPPIVDTPEPSRREATSHVGVINRLDPVLFDQNIHNATITWSTNDQPGTLLWYAELRPGRINPLIAYLADMYHYWSGGAEYEVKIAGTSFHAGMLCVVELPPHVHPTTLAGTRDYTAYNWHGIDAKNPSLEGFHVRDVRQVAFHFMDDVNDIAAHNIGGFIAIYVDMSLNTSSTGTQQVNVQIWSKPSRDFQMLKIRIPRPSTIEKPTSSVVSRVEAAFNYHAFPSQGVMGSSLAFPVYQMIVHPKEDSTFQIELPNHFSTEGEPMSQHPSFNTFSPFPFTVYAIGDSKGLGGGSVNVNLHPRIPFRVNRADEGGVLYSEATGSCVSISSWVDRVLQDEEDPHVQVSISISDAWSTAIEAKGLVRYICSTKNTDFLSAKKALVLPADESFISFCQQSNTKQQSLQTQEFSALCASKTLSSWVPKGMCAKFIMSDASAGVPVGVVKLYPEGYLTTKASKDEVRYDIDKMKLIFDGFAPKTEVLKTPVEFSRNRLLALPFHAHYRRH